MNLGKKVLGVTAAQVRSKLADIDRTQLPTLEQAREQVLTRELAQVQKQIEAEQQAALKAEPAQKCFAAAERIAELDALILPALLDKAIREPRSQEFLAVLAAADPPHAFVDFLGGIYAAQSQDRNLPAIKELITKREACRFRCEFADDDRLALLNNNAPALRLPYLDDTARRDRESLEWYDSVIPTALLNQAIRHPELIGDVQISAFRITGDFAFELNEHIAAIQKAQANNLTLSEIASLGEQRNDLARSLVKDLSNRYINDSAAYLAEILEIDAIHPEIAERVEARLERIFDARMKHADIQQQPQEEQNWDRDAANRAWEDALINAAIEKDKPAGGREKTDEAELERQPAALAERVLDGAGAVAELAIQGIEMVTDFLTGGTPRPSPHQIHAEILADIDALKRRNERDIPPQQDLIGKVLETAEPIAELGMRTFEMLTDFFGGGTALTPERMQAAIDERNQLRREAAEERKIDIERYRSDLEYRRHVLETKPWQTPEQQRRERENAGQTFDEERDRLR